MFCTLLIFFKFVKIIFVDFEESSRLFYILFSGRSSGGKGLGVFTRPLYCTWIISFIVILNFVESQGKSIDLMLNFQKQACFEK